MRGHGVSVAGAGGRLLEAAVVVALIVGACGAGASPSAVSGPDRVKEAGTLVWCSWLSYPPYESTAKGGASEGGAEAVGLDIDIAAEVARRLGVTSRIVDANGDDLFKGLIPRRCDLAISNMVVNFGPKTKNADFVDYLRIWTGFLVATGNPKGIDTMGDLAGKSVAVANEFFEEASLRAASADLVAAGKPAIEIVTTYKPAEAWVEELAAGRIDALAGDSVLVADRVDKPPYTGAFEIGGPALDPQPIGIAIRKDDAGMKEAVAAAIDAMYADGTMKAIVAKWGLTDAVELLK